MITTPLVAVPTVNSSGEILVTLSPSGCVPTVMMETVMAMEMATTGTAMVIMVMEMETDKSQQS
jgi:ABC-type arginine transport system ATPase subunit